MNAIENQVRELVKVELDAANERFPQFHSAHEGYSVILEEIEELEEATTYTRYTSGDLWIQIKDGHKPCAVSEVFENAINAACEAIQVAAMCQKFLEMHEPAK